MKSSILKDTRESKGMTLEMVHESTKIPLDALRAIEEGYSIRILTPFYYKGFVKNYAEFLGLDVEAVFKEYNLERSTKPQVHVPVPPPDRPASAPREKIANPIPNFLTPQTIAIVVKVIAIIICLVIAFKVFGWVGGAIKSAFSKPRQQKVQVKEVKKPIVKKVEEKKPAVKAKIESKKKEVVAPVVAVEEEMEDVPFVEEKVNSSSSKQENAIAKKVRLTVKAKKDSWLRVKADGSVVFQSTLRKGSSESWGANEEIELSGKNINLLEFEVNGKLLGQLGSSDRKAKKVIITKDGLSVKK